MEMADVGGYRLAAQIDGDIGATVVFLSGRDEGRKAWSQVLPLLQQPVRVLTYDRSGIGDSDARPHRERPVPYSVVAAELHGLLTAIALPGPYVLVGHSFGGVVARAYLAAYPAAVAGLVMVDISVPEVHLFPDPSPYVDGDRPDATIIDVVAGAAELPAPLAGRPAIVLTKSPGHWGGDPRYTAEVDAYWQQTQRDLAANLDATHIIGVDAGHRLHEQTPHLVALAINAVVRAVATGSAVALPPSIVAAVGGQLADARSGSR